MKPKYHRNSWLSRGKRTENGTTCDYSSVVTCVAGFYDRTDYRTKVLTKIDRKDRTIRPESWQYFFPASRTFILSWKNVVRDRRNFPFDIYRPVFFLSFYFFLFLFFFILLKKKLHIFRRRFFFLFFFKILLEQRNEKTDNSTDF